MEKIWKESIVYKIIACISHWIEQAFSNSFLIGLFVKEGNQEEIDKSTLFSRLIGGLIKMIQKIAHKIKLDVLFENSIFAKPIIWLTISMFLIPFVPTMIALALIAASGLSLVLKIAITPEFHLKYFRTNAWVLLFILVVCISAVTSISLEESRNIALLMSAFILSYFLIINTVESPKQLKFLLYVFIIASVITAFIGIYQYIFGDVYSQAWLDADMFEDIKMRVYSTFENPNVYGEYLLLAIPIIFSLFWSEKGLLKKLILFAMFAVTMLALVLTFSRGCWLGIILALGLLLIMIDRRFLWLGVLGLFVLPFVLPETIMNRFLSIGNLEDSSTSYRVYIWLGTIAMLKDYWFSGIGLGITSFNSIYPIYSYNNISAPHSHNLYLQLIVEYGIVGLIIFLGMIYHFYKETTISLLKEKNIITAGIMSGVAGFLLQSLFDNTWYNYRVVLIFWMIIALGLTSSKHIKNEISEENNDTGIA
ncbi:MAG: O-antigen ligase family protein [Clostridia bacterium]|nr:O-antigen ligase family protein [Clostridia bacterium]